MGLRAGGFGADLGPTLETPRLILRPPEQADFEAWAEFMAEADTMTFIGGVTSRAEAWQALAMVAGHWALRGFGLFGVIEKASGRWIGRVGPIFPEGWPGTEIGWGLARAHLGKGYATEAAAATMDWAFDTLGWTGVIHCIDPANTASIAVAERLGSAHRGKGLLPPPWQDQEVDLWGQWREEWRRRRASA
ncbi:MAG TPA: GNAT family N-acetyltransferase [Allosphingosinicella sp.]|jgi:RimJ/RimL family protein N-acetyltransferase